MNTHKRFVVYDIRDCADNMKGLALLILLDQTWNRIVRNRERHVRTWVFIDEMQLLFENDYAISYFDQLWTRSRKYGAIPTGITQNIERIINNEKSRLMLANSDFLVLLGQSASDAAALGEVIKLSERQVAMMRNAGPGEGLLVAGGKIIPFENRIPTDSAIYRMVTTKLDDLIQYSNEDGALPMPPAAGSVTRDGRREAHRHRQGEPARDGEGQALTLEYAVQHDGPCIQAEGRRALQGIGPPRAHARGGRQVRVQGPASASPSETRSERPKAPPRGRPRARPQGSRREPCTAPARRWR